MFFAIAIAILIVQAIVVACIIANIACGNLTGGTITATEFVAGFAVGLMIYFSMPSTVACVALYIAALGVDIAIRQYAKLRLMELAYR